MNYQTVCEKCGKVIINNININECEYTVCDSCEVTLCIDCIGEFNECPICGKEITAKENF